MRQRGCDLGARRMWCANRWAAAKDDVAFSGAPRVGASAGPFVVTSPAFGSAPVIFEAWICDTSRKCGTSAPGSALGVPGLRNEANHGLCGSRCCDMIELVVLVFLGGCSRRVSRNPAFRVGKTGTPSTSSGDESVLSAPASNSWSVLPRQRSLMPLLPPRSVLLLCLASLGRAFRSPRLWLRA